MTRCLPKFAISKALAACLTVLGLGAAPPPGWAETAAKGRQNSIEDCAACHRVTQSQKPPPPVPNPEEAISIRAPAFDVISRRYAGRSEALRDFIQAPRHPMREQQFIREDLEAITKYIASLRNEQW